MFLSSWAKLGTTEVTNTPHAESSCLSNVRDSADTSPDLYSKAKPGLHLYPVTVTKCETSASSAAFLKLSYG